MKVTLNGVDIGELPEPLFANMKLVTANDACDYGGQLYAILRAFWRRAIYTLAVTTAVRGVSFA